VTSCSRRSQLRHLAKFVQQNTSIGRVVVRVRVSFLAMVMLIALTGCVHIGYRADLYPAVGVKSQICNNENTIFPEGFTEFQ